MKAVAKIAPGMGNIAVIEADTPRIQPDEVLIKVHAAGLCGTDVSLYDWPSMIVEQFNPPLPVIMGHEFAGAIAEVGASVKELRPGEAVTANPVHYCGNCYFCSTGQINICDNRPLLGMQLPGCYAEYVKVRSKNVYRLPERVSYEAGALSELLSVAIHATERVALSLGENVAITGPGPVGLMLLLVCREAGAKNIVVTGTNHDRERLEAAAGLGAMTVNVQKDDPRKLVLDLTHGLGMDVVFEAAGHPSAVLQAIDLVRKGGRVGLIGMPHEKTTLHTVSWEKSLISSRAYTAESWRKCLHLLPVLQENLGFIVSHKLPLHQVEEGIVMMKEQKGRKLLVIP